MEIIQLKSRPASELVPIIKPLLDPGSSLSSMNNQLIIRASPEQITQVRKLLEQLDRPARKLIIYVRHGADYDIDRDGVSIDINKRLGRHTGITTGRRVPAGTARLRTRSATTRGSLDATQHVQTLEGKPAFIATGKSIPIDEQTTIISGGVVQQQNTVRYRDLTTGFYVVPHLNGNQVTLNISPHMERQGAIHGTFDISSANTRVRGQVGEWISIGGIAGSIDHNRSDILRRSSTSGHEERSIELLVQEIQ
jgi:type II secretory pathway component GspD/PulD (secretin)